MDLYEENPLVFEKSYEAKFTIFDYWNYLPLCLLLLMLLPFLLPMTLSLTDQDVEMNKSDDGLSAFDSVDVIKDSIR